MALATEKETKKKKNKNKKKNKKKKEKKTKKKKKKKKKKGTALTAVTYHHPHCNQDTGLDRVIAKISVSARYNFKHLAELTARTRKLLLFTSVIFPFMMQFGRWFVAPVTACVPIAMWTVDWFVFAPVYWVYNHFHSKLECIELNRLLCDYQ
ncbi:hypothetical protein ElyMa_004320400 [Elysia marginata]|uniref:Uncharacterized protein n=1 Tax=Elysia marginata TaxID=1093978 RepID=A0AAV4H086_9GAST|nr:hypothetical protein ElyMa_004320400 [Elysia marginata]